MKKNNKGNKNKLPISYIIGLVLILILWYITLPVVNIFYWGLPILIGIYGIFIFSIETISTKKLNKIGIVLIVVSILFTTLVPFFTSSAIFHSSDYRNIIGEISESSFIDDISPVDINQIRLVDQKMAIKLGDKKLGEDPALGSQAKLGTFNIQKVNDQLYWVAPLLHRSFFKWLGNKDGTRGYVMVSASNPQEVRLVQEIDNKPIKLKYQTMAYFNDDVKRHLYLNGYFNIGMTDYTFEIDEEGNPYWVITLFKKNIGYGGSDATGVVVVNAQNGEIKSYDINNAPKWVDRIQPEDFVKKQINNWGLYIKGWFNSVFAEEEVLEITPGMSLVYGKDNNSYWYTGITSSGSDESTVGFILVNTRTKEARLYRQSGATEIAAMHSAEGKVQEKNYVATFPIMYNVLGVPTYICSLKDKAGLVKQIAMISVEDYSILGIGETKSEALRSYRSALKSKGNYIGIKENVNETEIKGEVIRFNFDIIDGTSYYYLIINNADIIFVGTSDISPELPLTKVGDEVNIKYDNNESSVIDISEFDNLNIDLKK